eukprot:9850821-Alexandrium_andersonii.AAC.1
MNENPWEDDARAATEDLSGFATPGSGVYFRVFRNWWEVTEKDRAEEDSPHGKAIRIRELEGCERVPT